MSENPIREPAPNPCGSCPYRCDVPSGVWNYNEYEKLPEYDGPTHTQPMSVFMCHQQDGRLCAGWVAVHDMEESLGMKFLCSTGGISEEVYEKVLDYTTATPLFRSGQEAADHGMAEIETPSTKAKKVVAKLERKLK